MAIGNNAGTVVGIAAAMNTARRQATKQLYEGAEKSQFWLNIGYVLDVTRIDEATGKEFTEQLFISLPKGVALDTQEHLSTNSRNEDFANLNGAKNSLLDQLKALAETLAPGETKIMNLQVELRRVNEENTTATKPEHNPFIKKLDLVAAE